MLIFFASCSKDYVEEQIVLEDLKETISYDTKNNNLIISDFKNVKNLYQNIKSEKESNLELESGAYYQGKWGGSKFKVEY